MSVNVNEEGFHRRHAAVEKILQDFGLKPTSITPLAYHTKSPFPFNNYIYKVNLAEPALPAHFASTLAVRQPCTSPPPAAGVSTLVVRLSNPRADGLNNANRVENDVAAQHLMRESLAAAAEAGRLPSDATSTTTAAAIVPQVYAWALCRFPDPVPDETGFGWTLGEFKPGEDLDGLLPALSLDEVRAVCAQLAPVVAALQQAAVPATAPKFGALTIGGGGGGADGRTTLVSGQMPLLERVPGGPFDSYEQVWEARLRQQLAEAADSPLLRGWAANGVRARVEAFLESGGVRRVLVEGGVDLSLRRLIHGDLTTNNMLYDAAAKQITALLDFDWAAVTHPCDEFLSGLWDLGGGLNSKRMGVLQPLVLSGDFGDAPPPEMTEREDEEADEKSRRRWEIARMWDDALRRAGALRPSEIAGATSIQALAEFEGLLCPWELGSSVMLARLALSEEAQAEKRAAAERKVVQWLDEHASTTSA